MACESNFRASVISENVNRDCESCNWNFLTFGLLDLMLRADSYIQAPNKIQNALIEASIAETIKFKNHVNLFLNKTVQNRQLVLHVLKSRVDLHS